MRPLCEPNLKTRKTLPVFAFHDGGSLPGCEQTSLLAN